MKKFLLGDEWLEQAVKRFLEQGMSTEEIADHVNEWSMRTIHFILYLGYEGFSAKETAAIVNQAVEAANYDIEKYKV